MNKYGQTDNMSIDDPVKILESFTGQKVFDFVIYDNRYPLERLLKRYKGEGVPVYKNDSGFTNYKLLESDLLND